MSRYSLIPLDDSVPLKFNYSVSLCNAPYVSLLQPFDEDLSISDRTTSSCLEPRPDLVDHWAALSFEKRRKSCIRGSHDIMGLVQLNHWHRLKGLPHVWMDFALWVKSVLGKMQIHLVQCRRDCCNAQDPEPQSWTRRWTWSNPPNIPPSLSTSAEADWHELWACGSGIDPHVLRRASCETPTG